MKSINWLGVVLALVVNQAVGMTWYGFLFMQRWIDLALGGVAPTETAANHALIHGALLGLFQSFGLAWLIAQKGDNTLIKGATTGLMVAAFFSCGVVLQDLVYANRALELIGINASYEIVWLTLAGAAIGGIRWPRKKAA